MYIYYTFWQGISWDLDVSTIAGSKLKDLDDWRFQFIKHRDFMKEL